MEIEEQVLSIEQMKHLQELGVDTSDASMLGEVRGFLAIGFMSFIYILIILLMKMKND